MATSNKLLLKNANIQSFAGISKNNPIIISFPEGHRFFKAEGDQGTNKSSTMDALKALMSANLVPNAINSEDQDKKLGLRFVGKDGLLYQSKFTKTTFVLENIVTDETGEPALDDKNKERTREEKKPATLIKKLIGPLGIGPLELKAKNEAERLEWLQSHYSDGAEEFKAKEKEFKTVATNAYNKRTNVNRDVKRLDNVLEASDFFKRREFWENEFKVFEKEADLNKKIEEKKNTADEYIRVQEKVKNDTTAKTTNDTEITAIEAEIKRLQDLLVKKNELGVQINKSLEVNQKFIEDNKLVNEEYTTLKNEWATIQERKLDKVNFDAMLKSLEEKEKFEKESQELTADYKKAVKDLEDFIKSFTPDIPEFEVLVPTEENPKEGIFYKGKSIDQMCESELWEMCLMIWAAFDVRIVFVENINGLGTNAIERLNWFVENGGYVFATEMDRAEKNIKITINTKITD